MNATGEEGYQPQPAWAAFGSRLKLFRTLRKLTLDETGLLLGISGNYVYMIERGRLAPAAAVCARFKEILRSSDIFLVTMSVGGRERLVPVLSWAQAGRPSLFEEEPDAWQEKVATTCPDLEAFAIRIKGDSMETQYHEGDVVIAMPNYPPHHGCLVLVRMADDEGYLFKRFSAIRGRPHYFRLSSFNRAYSPQELMWDQVAWVYPVFCSQYNPRTNRKTLR